MKDGIGKEYTREDHRKISDQLFASYSKVQDARALAKVLGESDLSETDKKYLEFGDMFETEFLNQGLDENRDIISSLELKPNQTFLVSKYKKQVSYFDENILSKILKELTDLDYNYKNGKIDLDVGLRSILCNYCS